ncbi:hypothetical protein TI05_16345 [Achromatium sp. WMS3]|nr:hypothetical protein TI05_16345 [Achromatium sp. WMS3]
MSDQKSRRTFMEQSGKLILGAMLGSHIATASANESAPQDASTVDATTELCATCEYWGGIRQISEDTKTVTGTGMGWCNNPKSRNYRKMTKPDAGTMIAWKQWGALS